MKLDADDMKILALDFDGVISNSAPEAYLVALRTYLSMRPGSRLEAHRGPSECGLDAIVAHALYRQFIELLPLGNRAEDFGVELVALDEGLSIPDQMWAQGAPYYGPLGFR